jgi:hypothetical protein
MPIYSASGAFASGVKTFRRERMGTWTPGYRYEVQ